MGTPDFHARIQRGGSAALISPIVATSRSPVWLRSGQLSFPCQRAEGAMGVRCDVDRPSVDGIMRSGLMLHRAVSARLRSACTVHAISVWQNGLLDVAKMH